MNILEKEMAAHFSILAWRIPWTEKPGGLSSMGSQRVRHNWSDLAAYMSINININKYIYKWITLLYPWNQYNIVNQPYFNKIKKWIHKIKQPYNFFLRSSVAFYCVMHINSAMKIWTLSNFPQPRWYTAALTAARIIFMCVICVSFQGFPRINS